MFSAKRIIVFTNFVSRVMASQKLATHITIPQRLAKLGALFKTQEQNGDVVPFFKKCLLHAERIAIKNLNIEYSYQQLYIGAKQLSVQISNICGSGSSSNIAVFCENDALLPLSQWGCWMSGQVFVPLLYDLPYKTLNFIIHDCKTKLIISTKKYEFTAKKFAELLDIPVIIIDLNFMPEHNSSHCFLKKLLLIAGDDVFIEGTLNNDFYSCSDALLVYNANQVEKPKGCIISHKNLQSRIKITTEAWNYKPHDFLLNLLPTHYSTHSVHSLMCLLNVGGKVSFCNDQNCQHIWSRILSVNLHAKDRPNMLTALPSTYIKIIHEYNKIYSKNSRMSEYIKDYCENNFRLMVSGPLPLPINIYHYWNNITGRKLLRYNETPETGVLICEPYFEDKKRKKQQQQNSIGLPMPQTNIRIVNSKDEIILTYTGETFESTGSASLLLSAQPEPLVGELHVSGPHIFKGYIHETVTRVRYDNHFFKTGVIVEFENGVFRFLGHDYDDIVTRAGQSLSRYEIEALLHTHPKIKDVAVGGVPHTLWKEQIYTLCVLEAGMTLDLVNIQSFCAKWLPPNMCPLMLQIVPNINRNSKGRVDQTQLTKLHLL